MSVTSARAFLSRFLVALVVVCALIAVAIGGAYAFAAQKVHSIRTASISTAVLKGGQNYLLIGSDTRAFVHSAAEAQAFGSAQTQTGQRSDTIMVAHVDPATHRGFVVSFPRDLWVDIPGIGRSKINAAFNAGPQRVIETIEQNFDVPIGHYLEVDFAGFRNIVNALGTIPLYFPAPARDTKSGLNVPQAGCQRLNGDQALAYVRSRFYEYFENGRWRSDPTSDLGRIRRQQYFMRTLAQEALHASTRRPWRVNSLLDKTFTSLTRDPKLGLGGLRALAYALRGGNGSGLEMTTLPATPQQIAGQSVLVVNDSAAAPLLARLRVEGGSTGTAKVPTIAPSSVSVAVRNATSHSGLGRSALDALRSLGFTAPGPATNASHGRSTTEVQYGPGDADKARVVQAQLRGVGRLVALSDRQTTDVVLVLGGDFNGVAASTTTSPPTTAATSGTAASPGPTSAPAPSATSFPIAGCPGSSI